MSDAICPLIPDWPAPACVRAACSTRAGGVSRGAWAGLNLGRSSGDVSEDVSENRRRFLTAIGAPSEPRWLSQVHGTRVVRWPAELQTPEADAAYTTEPGVVCAVQAADCMPVLFCDDAGLIVAAAHAGWRGMAGGVLAATVHAMSQASGLPPQRLQAWLGPAIGPGAFEVGEDVLAAFAADDPGAAQGFRARPEPGKYLANLDWLARRQLRAAGLERIYGGGLCTLSDPQRFFSFRRDRQTGRMAAVIWIDAVR